MATAIQTGYIVLADLSGYTQFVASTELDHAQSILSHLLDLLRRQLTPALDLAEIEGDALFLYVADARMTRGETLLELVESTYVAFRDRLQAIQRTVTCPCQACRALPSLDLKFVIHSGDYVLQDVAGAVKPFGSCVNLAHRLLKNPVVDETGWTAYALITDTAMERMAICPPAMHRMVLSYDHLGEWPAQAIDLGARHQVLTAERMAYLTTAAAHRTYHRRFRTHRARLWEALNDLHRRGIWQSGTDWSAVDRPDGRVGPGAHNHCSNSNFVEEVLDWRPFDYYTVRLMRGPIRMLITGELHAVGEATDLRWSIALEGRLPGWLRAAGCRLILWILRTGSGFDRLTAALDDEAATSSQATGPR